MFTHSANFKNFPCPYISSNQPCDLEEFCVYNHNFITQTPRSATKKTASTQTAPTKASLTTLKTNVLSPQPLKNKEISLDTPLPMPINSQKPSQYILSYKNALLSTLPQPKPATKSIIDSNSAAITPQITPTKYNPPPKDNPNTKTPADIRKSSASNISVKNRIPQIYSAIPVEPTCPSVKAVPNQKVKWNFRQTILEKIYSEYSRIYASSLTTNPKLISDTSLEKELEIYLSSTPTTYKNNAAGTLASLKRTLPASAENDQTLPEQVSHPTFITKSPANTLSAPDALTVSKVLPVRPAHKKINIDDPKVANILIFFILPQYKLVMMDYPLETILEPPARTLSTQVSDSSPKSIISEFMDTWNEKILQNKKLDILFRISCNTPSNVPNVDRIDSLLDVKLVCDRCNQVFVNKSPLQFPEIKSHCSYHCGKLKFESTPQNSGLFASYRTRKPRNPKDSNATRKYSCCGGDPFDPPCDTGPHVFRIKNDYVLNLISHFEKPSSTETEKTYKLLALDCEMCATTMGYELSRLTVVDHCGNIVIDELVKPVGEVLDLNTRFSGVKSLDDANFTFHEIKSLLLEYVSSETILLGHGLENDLRVLRIIHDKVIDTVNLFPHRKGLPFRNNLKDLALAYLGNIIQGSKSGHDSLEDSLSCLYLLDIKVRSMLKIKSS